MDPKSFYAGLWRAKAGTSGPLQQRDPLHRWVLDPIFDPAANSRHDVALRMLAPGHRLLDVGCWNGELLSKIRAANLFAELRGIDLIPESVSQAQARGFRADVVDLNHDPLPFGGAEFDAVTMLAVLEHVFDPYAILDEIRRVLAPRGALVIAVPNAASLTNRLRILAGRIPVTSGDPGWDGGHLHYFTKHAFDRLLCGAGFEIISRRTTGGRPALREWWISLLSGEMIYQCRRR